MQKSKRPTERPVLTPGNLMYLYDVLRREVGCGRQVLMPHIEEALEAHGLDAASLGFESCRELMEAMGEIVSLTVFKGGRVYVTVAAKPEWDEALDAPAKKQAGGGAKTWRRKRSGKALRPQRPKTVAVPKEPEPEAPVEPAIEQEPEREPATEPVTEPEAAMAPADEPEPEWTLPDAMDAVAEAEAEPEPSGAPEPSISITVTFDPDDVAAGETTIESTPSPAAADADRDRSDAEAVADAPAGDAMPARSVRASAEPSTAGAPAPAAPEARPASPAGPQAPAADDPDAYPQDFAREVFCPGPVLSDLARLLPFGADALGIAGEYLYIACLAGTVERTRGRVAFPLRYLADGERKTARVTIRRRPSSQGGLPWAIESVETGRD